MAVINGRLYSPKETGGTRNTIHPETNMSNIVATPDGRMLDEAIGPSIIVGGTTIPTKDKTGTTGRPVIHFKQV